MKVKTKRNLLLLAAIAGPGTGGFLNKASQTEGYRTKEEAEKELIPAKYDGMGDFYEGLALVQSGGELFYVNKQGGRVKDAD